MDETAVQVSKMELCWALWKLRRKYQEIGLLILLERHVRKASRQRGVDRFLHTCQVHESTRCEIQGAAQIIIRLSQTILTVTNEGGWRGERCKLRLFHA
jgi:hypothetical protein